MSTYSTKDQRLPASYWRGILIFSVLWLAIGFGAAIAWGNMNPPEKHSARFVIKN